MKTKTILTIVAALLVLVSTAAFVPPVREAVIRAFSSVTVFTEPMPFDPASVSGYLPQFESGPIAASGSISAIPADGLPVSGVLPLDTSIYQKGDLFLVFTAAQADPNESLPVGEALTVNGLPGVLNSALSGEYTFGGSLGQDADGNPVQLDPTVITYTDANEITWMDGNTKYTILSNLSVDELLDIAATLTAE